MKHLSVIISGLALVLQIPLRTYAQDAVKPCKSMLTARILQESLSLGTSFLLNNQLPEGNFAYEYLWRSKKDNFGDNQVRQAGALWGLSLIYQSKPEPRIRAALLKGFSFFDTNSKLTQNGSRYTVYPGEQNGSLGTVALVALAYIDFLRTDIELPTAERKVFHQKLSEYLAFLVAARMPSGLWFGSYQLDTGTPFGQPSPYSDGEALLALVKAARYLDRPDLRPIVLDSASAGLKVNVMQALATDPDSNTTKGYYQWGSMAFFEIAQSGWNGGEVYAQPVLTLAQWMIDVHKTLTRERNTAYAYEGIVHAYELARQRDDKALMQKFGCVIEKGLEKLTSWQVGSSIANKYITSTFRQLDLRALGGVQNHKAEEGLRIDVTQHQMHAVILALKYYYPDQKQDSKTGAGDLPGFGM